MTEKKNQRNSNGTKKTIIEGHGLDAALLLRTTSAMCREDATAAHNRRCLENAAIEQCCPSSDTKIEHHRAVLPVTRAVTTARRCSRLGLRYATGRYTKWSTYTTSHRTTWSGGSEY